MLFRFPGNSRRRDRLAKAKEESLLMKKKIHWISIVLLVLAFFPSPALAAPPTQGEDLKAKADTLYQEAISLYNQADYQGAINHLEQALSLYQNIGDREDEVKTLNNLGELSRSLGKYQQALSYYQQAQVINRELGDRSGEGIALNNIAAIYYRFGQNEQALKYFQEALAIRKDVGDRSGEGTTLNNIGAIYQRLGQYKQAMNYIQQALAIHQELGDLSREAATLNNIGYVYGKTGQYEQALSYYQQALAILREIGDRLGEGTTLNNIGAAYHSVGQYQQALDFNQQALAIHQELGDLSGEAISLVNIADVYISQGQYQKALDNQQQALAIQQEIGDRAGQATTLADIGLVYNNLGQYEQAMNYVQQALDIYRELGQQSGEAVTINNLAGIYVGLGQYEQGMNYFQQALAIHKEIGDRSGEGSTLNNIGYVYGGTGQYEQALSYYQQALAIHKEIGDRSGEGTSLNNIGTVYDDLGQYQSALNYYQQALAIHKEIGDRSGEATTLNNISLVYNELGQYQSALNADHQALAIFREIGERAGEATLLGTIGGVYYSVEQYQQALSYYQQALAIHKEIGDRSGEGTSLNNIGLVYYSLRQYPEALDYYQQSLAIAQEIGDRTQAKTILGNIGVLYDEQDDNVQAMSYYQQAIEVIESIQGDIKIRELKTSFASQQVDIYERLINLLWDNGHFQEAFNYVERARARAFLDGLAGGAVDFRAGANSTGLEREQLLKAEILSLHTELVKLRNRPQDEWDTDAIAAVRSELSRLETDYAQLLTDIKLLNPEVSSLVSVNVASLDDIQRLIDEDTTLLEYYVSPDRTFVFIITNSTFEPLALEVSLDDLTHTVATFRDFANLDDTYPTNLKQLYSWLITPLKDRLKTPLVGIIPHGVLHYLPFAALTDGASYLSDDYSLFTLPSASVLRFIQEKRKPESNTVLALGNPTTDLPSLHFAEQEAESIAKLYRTQALLGTTATESSVWDNARKVAILHLAAHGEYNSNNPLFSAIHLAGDTQNDGRLEVHEVYSLDLTAATNLVVLSACETNIGAVSAGDEVVGLNRAFLYAGTPTVISSLWNVDDAATALLMERFYTHLRAGMSKGEALRQAQMDVRGEYPHPYYWASFVLTGDPGPVGKMQLTLPFSINNWSLWIGGIGSSLLGIVVCGLIVIRASRAAEKRRLRKQLDLLLENRRRWKSQPDSPMRSRVLRQISHKLREMGRKEQRQ
jgi:tetratricopeptide (TPR) repeat protein/CHAT domain-containing protein